MFTKKKIAVVSVINDLVTDNRVNKTCLTLIECGYSVTLIGRKLPKSTALPNWPFKAIRMQLLFLKGPLFYFFFNTRLFFKLLFTKADLLYANDLDTLLPNFLVSKLKAIPLIYDSHELFCEVPELMETPMKRKIWLKLEKALIPKLKTCITVNNSIANWFENRYGVRFYVVRNIADVPQKIIPKSKEELNLPNNTHIILMQGAGINMDRGAEELVEAMCFVENALLLLIGGGDVWPKLKLQAIALSIQHKVRFIDKIPKQELLNYTQHAAIGLSIDKNTNPNYYYSLPNKLFDYILSGVPILATRLPEIENIINKFEIGDFIENHNPKEIANKINEMLSNPNKLQTFRENTYKAASQLNWDSEKQTLIKAIQSSV